MRYNCALVCHTCKTNIVCVNYSHKTNNKKTIVSQLAFVLNQCQPKLWFSSNMWILPKFVNIYWISIIITRDHLKALHLTYVMQCLLDIIMIKMLLLHNRWLMMKRWIFKSVLVKWVDKVQKMKEFTKHFSSCSLKQSQRKLCVCGCMQRK